MVAIVAVICSSKVYVGYIILAVFTLHCNHIIMQYKLSHTTNPSCYNLGTLALAVFSNGPWSVTHSPCGYCPDKLTRTLNNFSMWSLFFSTTASCSFWITNSIRASLDIQLRREKYNNEGINQSSAQYVWYYRYTHQRGVHRLCKLADRQFHNDSIIRSRPETCPAIYRFHPMVTVETAVL